MYLYIQNSILLNLALQSNFKFNKIEFTLIVFTKSKSIVLRWIYFFVSNPNLNHFKYLTLLGVYPIGLEISLPSASKIA